MSALRSTRSIAGGAVLLIALIGGALVGCCDDATQAGTEAVSGNETATFDTIRIENQDDRGHTVGPFFVGANETLTQRFSTPGEFESVCTVHRAPSGQLVLIVNT